MAWPLRAFYRAVRHRQCPARPAAREVAVTRSVWIVRTDCYPVSELPLRCDAVVAVGPDSYRSVVRSRRDHWRTMDCRQARGAQTRCPSGAPEGKERSWRRVTVAESLAAELPGCYEAQPSTDQRSDRGARRHECAPAPSRCGGSGRHSRWSRRDRSGWNDNRPEQRSNRRARSRANHDGHQIAAGRANGCRLCGSRAGQ
jgi:hypothetical protein